MSTDAIVIRKLPLDELGLIRDLDRTEQIDALYVQHGTRLELRESDWSAPPWDTTGEGEHSVAGQQATLEQFVRDGAIVLGAFDDGQLVGVGVVVVHIRPETAQLAYLYVTRRERARGVGRRLSDALEDTAREAGNRSRRRPLSIRFASTSGWATRRWPSHSPSCSSWSPRMFTCSRGSRERALLGRCPRVHDARPRRPARRRSPRPPTRRGCVPRSSGRCSTT